MADQITRPKGRFIAGAVCPRCSAMDRIIITEDTDSRFCIDCGFTDARPEPPAPELPQTRVTRPAARRVETVAEAVRLIDPKADKTD